MMSPINQTWQQWYGTGSQCHSHVLISIESSKCLGCYRTTCSAIALGGGASTKEDEEGLLQGHADCNGRKRKEAMQ